MGLGQSGLFLAALTSHVVSSHAPVSVGTRQPRSPELSFATRLCGVPAEGPKME